MADLTVVRPDQPSSVQRLMEDFLTSCRARGLSPATLRRGYEPPLLRLLLPWCEQNGIMEIAELDQRTIDRFTVELHEKGGPHRAHLAQRSIHSYVRTIGQFLRWCRSEGEAVNGKPQLPRLSRKVIDVLSRDEIDAIEGAVPYERDALIIRLLADTGIRSDELCTLRPTSLVRRDRRCFLSVKGNGGHERLVPLSPSLARRIERYLQRRPKDTTSPYIFVGLRRERRSDFHALTTSGVRSLVQGAAERAGITKRVYPHLFRHSFATEALRRGMNAVQLSTSSATPACE